MYLAYNKKTIETDDQDLITEQYNNGFVFTRENLGTMDQTRSIRIDLEKFELSSENKRILRKTEDLVLETLPIPYSDYHWSIGKLAKDFYDTKFSKNIFSANKVKQVLTNNLQGESRSERGCPGVESNFNLLLSYKLENKQVGYSICYKNKTLIHYSYPFYDLESDKNTGMGMMLKAINFAKSSGVKYIYLGSAQRSSDIYKLQFKGLEWFDNDENKFSSDQDKLKNILKQI